MTISLNQQIEEINRELMMREKVYPSMIARGKIRQSEADFYVNRLKATRMTLQWLQTNEQKIKACVAAASATGTGFLRINGDGTVEAVDPDQVFDKIEDETTPLHPEKFD